MSPKDSVDGRSIPDEFWDEKRGRYNSHLYFDTINHSHLCDYSGDKSCDLMVVECRDGNWYVEDQWEDAKGADGVFNPYQKGAYPSFYPSYEDAMRKAAEVISSITGMSVDKLLKDDD